MGRVCLFFISVLLFSACINNQKKGYGNSDTNKEIIYLGNRSDSCLHKTYYENGSLKIEEKRVNDTLVGTKKIYYKNGQLKKTTQFKNGKAHGILKVFDIDGFLKREYLYLRDSQIVANIRSHSDSTVKNLHLNVNNEKSFLIDSTIKKINEKNFNTIIHKFNIKHKDTIVKGDTLNVTVQSNVVDNQFIQLIVGDFNNNFKLTSEENLLNIRSYKGKINFSSLDYNMGDNLFVGWFIKGYNDSTIQRIFYTTFYVKPKQ
jgi:hypothetical protein